MPSLRAPAAVIPCPEHPSHDIREMDMIGMVSMPECIRCGLSPIDHPKSIQEPCGRAVTTYFWQGLEAYTL